MLISSINQTYGEFARLFEISSYSWKGGIYGDYILINHALLSFSGLRKILDAEMRQLQAEGITNKKAEKMVVEDEEERKMWEQGLLGDNSAKALINNTICIEYFYSDFKYLSM